MFYFIYDHCFWKRARSKVVVGVDKQKARRQRNIHLSVVCGYAADMSRDLLYVKSITFVCEVQKQEDKRLLGSQKETARRN